MIMILMIILILTMIMILNVIASLILVQSVSPSMRLTTLFSTGNLQLSNSVEFTFVSPMDFRQAFKVCEPEPCSDFADRGYVCAPVWTCRNNTVITDGKVNTPPLTN